MRFQSRLVCTTVVAAMIALPVIGQTLRPDRAIRYRQGVLTAMNWHFGVLGSMVKGDRPYDKALALRSATFVDQLAKMPWEGFLPGTDKGAPTKARPEVFTNVADFKSHQDKLIAEMPKLVAAANTGDPAALRTAVIDVDQACKSCHDDYREK